MRVPEASGDLPVWLRSLHGASLDGRTLRRVGDVTAVAAAAAAAAAPPPPPHGADQITFLGVIDVGAVFIDECAP
jgi:hypothetical protein